ncbi:MAG: hypothetical protein V7K50_18830 [Nostoc sp.]
MLLIDTLVWIVVFRDRLEKNGIRYASHQALLNLNMKFKNQLF